MFDRELVLESLKNIRTAIDTIMERTAVVSNPDEFLHSQDGISISVFFPTWVNYDYIPLISLSGIMTKSRSFISGWGTLRSGSSIWRSSKSRMSISMGRSW